MKNLNLSFALIAAVLTVGVTIATKANFSGKRVITVCFTQLQIKNMAGETFNLASSVSCRQARAEVTTKPIVNSAVVGTAIPSWAVCDGDDTFCCAEVTEMNSSDPLYASAPFINLGEGMRKYKIAASFEVFCHFY